MSTDPIVCFFQKAVLVCVNLSLVAVLTSCYLPGADDDFSVLGNDPFSNLIRETSIRSRFPNAGFDGIDRSSGVSKLDPQTMAALSRELFLGKSSLEIIKIFTESQGRCDSDSQKYKVSCNVARRWELKNIGASTDTSKWEKPGVKLLYNFVLSESNIVIELELKIINITEFPSN